MDPGSIACESSKEKITQIITEYVVSRAGALKAFHGARKFFIKKSF
jgi:hypothetical protein